LLWTASTRRGALHAGVERKENPMSNERKDESGRIGYLVLYLMGVPVGLLLVLWLVLGNNIFGPG
jgi:hypothetical protein